MMAGRAHNGNLGGHESVITKRGTGFRSVSGCS
jgi:hypothetical protein